MAVVGGLLGLAVLPGLAGAAWNATAPDGRGGARTLAMPTVAAPTVGVQGRSVTVSWPVARFANVAATPVAGYEVRRYNATTGAAQVVGAGCAGTITALSCTERSVPVGSWRYSVVTRMAGWTGGEGASTTATVGSPSLALSTASLDNAGAPTTSSTTASVTNLLEGEVVTFSLESDEGVTLATATADAAGTAQATITLPYGAAPGSTRLVARGSQGSNASAPLQVAAAARTLVVTASTANPTAGSTVTVTVQALVNGVPDSALAGTRAVSVTGLGGALNGSASATVPTSATFDSTGTATVSVVPVRTGTPTMTVSIPAWGHSGSTSLNVRLGTVASIAFVTSPCPTGALGNRGVWDSAVRATDVFGNMANPANSINVVLSSTGSGSLSTTSVQIAAGSANATSSSFRAALSAGNNQFRVTATAGDKSVSCTIRSN